MMAVDPASLNRLAKICGLFGSDQMGERAAAAHQAETLRKRIGLSWEDLLTRSGGGHRDRHDQRDEQPGPFTPRNASPMALLARCDPALTDWEREFLRSVGTQRTYTPRQAARLDAIRFKCATWWTNGGRA